MSNNTDSRILDIAHRINAHLPAAYQQDILAEARRFYGEYLAVSGRKNRLILVVGGAGYVGTVICDHLLNRGYKVRSFDKLIYNQGICVTPFLHHPGFEFVHGDLTDADQFARALDGVTDVVLLAGLVGDPITKKFPDAAKRINDDGHDAMLAMLDGRGLNKLVFVSTCSNYGLIEGHHLAAETHELNPLSLYAKSKVRIEKALIEARGATDYSPTILRFATAFGLSPRMRFDLTVSEFTRALALGENLLVYDADTWRPYCHLRDFAELIRRTLEAPRDRVAFEIFNAGGDANNFTKQMIVDAILKQLPGAAVRYQAQGADPRNYRVDFAKVRERLFFEPAYSIRDGIAELIHAIRQGLFHDISQPVSYYGNWQPALDQDVP